MANDDSTVEGSLLVPIANEETAERQLETAIDIATDRSYRIQLVYVLEVPVQLSLQDGVRYLLEDETTELLSEAAARVDSRGVPVEQRIRVARGVATGIVGAVAEYDIDALVLGWRGRPPRQNIVLGGHLDRVLRRAECDVLVERIKTPRPETVESVLVPVAGGPHTEFAAEAAASIARQNGASVTLLRVSDPDAAASSRDEAAILERTTTAFEGVQAVDRELLEDDDVAGTITDWTADHDVTVLGVSRGGLLQRKLLGTISEAVGRHAAGSVILAQRYDPVPSRLRRLLP
ncbi:universal stress protein [Natronolimnohabitans innermongolicus]|uniref:UspA domain-containing protein n=1 Tax=Natronolimnohabitans innermongolicus JCM 12255 TaxID=1227499 RepID=L9XAD8_9EURY|nr:universal stress protein [Natronolimnohabitans innermongolicus]ELY58719.1 UspA domain-containing protein [Natronolimnohabitans innermongolicus JCM 12255]